MTDPASAPSAAARRRAATKPLPGARWRIEREAHVSPRRILEAGKAVAYGTTDAHAHRLMQTLNLAQILLVTLEIARDVLAPKEVHAMAQWFGRHGKFPAVNLATGEVGA